MNILYGILYKQFDGLEGYIEGLVQDCSNSSALEMELLQSCTKPSIYVYKCIYLLIES